MEELDLFAHTAQGAGLLERELATIVLHRLSGHRKNHVVVVGVHKVEDLHRAAFEIGQELAMDLDIEVWLLLQQFVRSLEGVDLSAFDVELHKVWLQVGVIVKNIQPDVDGVEFASRNNAFRVDRGAARLRLVAEADPKKLDVVRLVELFVQCDPSERMGNGSKA